jgi:hypothetical protein
MLLLLCCCLLLRIITCSRFDREIVSLSLVTVGRSSFIISSESGLRNFRRFFRKKQSKKSTRLQNCKFSIFLIKQYDWIYGYSTVIENRFLKRNKGLTIYFDMFGARNYSMTFFSILFQRVAKI